MNRFTIYCTPELTKKALELGAHIERGHEGSRYFNIGVPTFYDENDEVCRVKNSIIFIPTAEQMIGWLEEQDIFVSINHIREGYSSWLKTISDNKNISENLGYVSSRKEATFAAIDAALEYLSNNKK